MTRLRILFDADDVAETLLEGWVRTLNERYGTTTLVEDVTDWDISKAFPTLTKQQIYGVLRKMRCGQSSHPCLEHKSI